MIKGFDLLEIDEKSGDLRTRIPIDREALCGRRESPDCIFEAEIITKPQSLFKLFKVELEVEDLNDNAPVFPNSKIDINLSEETQLGSLIRLGKFTHIYQHISVCTGVKARLVPLPCSVILPLVL